MARTSEVPAEQRLERGAGDLIGELGVHEIELRLSERGLGGKHVENRGDAGTIPRPDYPQLLGSEPHRLARERDVLLGDVEAAEQPLCLRTREALGVRGDRGRDL